MLGLEPRIARTVRTNLEFHGNLNSGWCIVKDSLSQDSVVVDIGLGEDISFSASVIHKYGCAVYGFDPTPKAIRYVRKLANSKVQLFEFGIGLETGPAKFYLPNNEAHVSGALIPEDHLGRQIIEVNLLSITDIMRRIGCSKIDLLKMDIEGAEFEIIKSPEFGRISKTIGQLCVEFHHRWKSYGKKSTEEAVKILHELGFKCAWSSPTTNEEFLFVRR